MTNQTPQPPPPAAEHELPTGPGVWVREGVTYLIWYDRGVCHLNAYYLTDRGHLSNAVWLPHLPRGHWHQAAAGEGEPPKARCGHAAYRGFDNICLEPECLAFVSRQVIPKDVAELAEARLAEAEREANQAGTPYSVERDTINQLILARDAALAKVAAMLEQLESAKESLRKISVNASSAVSGDNHNGPWRFLGLIEVEASTARARLASPLPPAPAEEERQ